MPVIVNEKHYHRVKGLLAGQTAAIGGETDDETRFIAPTVLTGVSPDEPDHAGGDLRAGAARDDL